MRDRPVAETSTLQQTTLKTDRQKRTWRDSKLHSQQASRRRPIPKTAQLLVLADFSL